MTGGQALAASLAAEGIEVVFGVPGAGQYEAVDGIYEQPRIRYVATRHEQATSYMADGYTRASGKPAAILVVPGPGMYNAMSGITGACSQGSPMMVISGEGHADRPVDDELAFVRGITKWAGKAEAAADVAGAVHDAFLSMRTGRPGPAYLEVPHRVLAATADTEPRESAPGGGREARCEEHRRRGERPLGGQEASGPGRRPRHTSRVRGPGETGRAPAGARPDVRRGQGLDLGQTPALHGIPEPQVPAARQVARGA